MTRRRRPARSALGSMLQRLQADATSARRTGEPITEARERSAAITRRRFLQGSAGLGAVLALPALACSSSGDDQVGTTSSGTAGGAAPMRVTVVGAGLAGLTAARRLALAGADVTVHEFSERVGGRTRTVRDFFADGRTAESGGEFINSDHRALRALLRELGLDQDDLWEGYPDGTRGRDVYGGAEYTRTDLAADWGAVAPAVDRDLAALGPDEVLWDSHTDAAVAIDRMSLAEWIEQNVPGGRTSRLGRYLEVSFLGEWGGPIEDQSAINLLTTVGSGSGGTVDLRDGQDYRWHVSGGNDQVAARLGDGIGEGRLRFGSELVAVRSTNDGVSCSFDEAGTVNDVVSDRVVLALPFSLLRDVDLAGADLSDRKRRLIGAHPMGTNSKLHLEFASRAWRNEGLNGDTSSDTGLMTTWDGVISEPGDAGVLVNFTGGEAGAAYGFADAHGPAPEADVAARDADVATVFGQSTLDASTGRGWLDSWFDDEFARGSYAYWAAGQYTELRGAGGTPEGPIHFCGEHTSIGFEGFMNGAVETGERAAAEILEET